MNQSWKCLRFFALFAFAGCAHEQADALPACDAPAVQAAAQKVAAETVKVPFVLSSFTEVKADSTGTHRACRVRAKHAASGAAIWMRFTLESRPAKQDEKTKGKTEPADELVVVFAPIE